jgi:hypothetical protein
MPRLIPITLLALTFACTSTNQEASSQDSTVVDSISTSEVANQSVDEVAVNVVETEPLQDTSQLATVYDQQLVLATNDESKYYIVSVTVSQYEGGADVTWYFDKELSPRYFKERWSMEGNDGITELMISNGSVVCSFMSNTHTEDKWCVQNGGLHTVWGDDTIVRLLERNYGETVAKELDDNFTTLKNILKDGKITSESSDSYIVRIEQTIDVGQEVTEYTEVDIPKMVYDKLMN